MAYISNEKNLKIFYNKIKFDKSSYKLYTNILTKKKSLNNYLFVLLICQAAQQLSFEGTFHDLYFDIVQNRTFYIKQINRNLKTAYLCSENAFILILKNLFNCGKSERETAFDEYITAFNFDGKIDDNFVGDDIGKLDRFVTICDELLSQRVRGTRIDKIFPIG